jgi:hypothetical protein
MEILASYVRNNAVRKPGKAEEEHDLREFRAGQERADIQAIISVLGKHAGRYGEEEDDRIVLYGTDLRNATFHDRKLHRALVVARGSSRSKLRRF